MAEVLRTAIDLDDAAYQAAARRVVDATNKIIDIERQVVPATATTSSGGHPLGG
jgi:hypothetical protein